MARSGTIEVPIGGEGTFSPRRWFPVCSVGNLGAKEGFARSVRVRVGKASYDTPLYQAGLPAGVWWTPDSDFTRWIGANYFGVLRFTYGSLGMQRELFCDLRSGEYQIPPCQFLRVDATRYTPATTHGGEDPFTVDPTPYSVEGEIADGTSPDFTPMLFTAPSEWGALDADEFAQVAAPPGAYAFEVYGGRSDADFAGNRFATAQPASVRDFVTGVWLPPSSPLPLIHPYVQISTGNTVRSCDLVFWVR